MSAKIRQKSKNTLRVKRLGIDTYSKLVIYMRQDCHICKSEGFEALSKVAVSTTTKTIIASLNILDNDLLDEGAQGLGFGQSRFDATVGDQSNREVAKHGGTVRAGNPEFMSTFAVTHVLILLYL